MVTRAWELAHDAARAAGVELRPLDELEDAERILRVMIATWGDHQLVPREMLRALGESGNVPYGAFDGGETVGYVLGWAGVDDEGLHVHSHMLAALPDRRHRGVGYALKLAQRAQALDQGIGVVRWTFDPLVARNAYFNLHKLGAVADRFERSFYGEMTDTLNRGDRTDRVMVRWTLDRDPGPRNVLVSDGWTILHRDGERPGELLRPSGPRALVEIPRDHAELRAVDPALGAKWREAAALAIESCLEAGLVAAAFDGERSRYVFVEREEVSA